MLRQYRRDNPKMPTLKLARIIFNEGDNKLLFSNVESVRKVLLQIEGKFGANNTAKKDKEAGFHVPDRPRNPYNLPDSDEETFEPYYIKGHKRVLVINDVHLPYHSLQAVTAAFDFAKKEKPDAIFINGDLLDFHSISYFEKDPRKKSFATELSMFKEFFITLQKTFKGAKIYFKFGNHEERYEKFLFQKAKELIGVEEFDLSNIIKARAEGIEVIADKRIVLMNDLPFVHGHEMGRGVFNPVNAARGLFLQAKHSCVKGDCHSSSEHTETDIMGKIMTTWSVGALCGLHPAWLPINRWNHGFAINDLGCDGEGFEFRNYRIYKGKVL
jgi:predicted phosphodiesterase